MNNITYIFCSWNVRGLGHILKCDEVLSEIISINPALLVLQDTKLNDIPSLKAKKFLPKHLQTFHFKPSTGSAGEILTATSSKHFSLAHTIEHSFSLSTTITSTSNNQKMIITNVYAPTDHSLKPSFLSEIEQICPSDDTPWMIIGDFNLMRSSIDKNNTSFRQDEPDAFNDVINNLALIELPLMDRLYTWSTNR
jgi:exonuclease III